MRCCPGFWWWWRQVSDRYFWATHLCIPSWWVARAKVSSHPLCWLLDLLPQRSRCTWQGCLGYFPCPSVRKDRAVQHHISREQLGGSSILLQARHHNFLTRLSFFFFFNLRTFNFQISCSTITHISARRVASWLFWSDLPRPFYFSSIYPFTVYLWDLRYLYYV